MFPFSDTVCEYCGKTLEFDDMRKRFITKSLLDGETPHCQKILSGRHYAVSKKFFVNQVAVPMLLDAINEGF